MTQSPMWPLTAVTLGIHSVTLVKEHVRVTISGVEQQSLVNVCREDVLGVCVNKPLFYTQLACVRHSQTLRMDK